MSVAVKRLLHLEAHEASVKQKRKCCFGVLVLRGDVCIVMIFHAAQDWNYAARLCSPDAVGWSTSQASKPPVSGKSRDSPVLQHLLQ
jgi:hypothetical protein